MKQLYIHKCRKCGYICRRVQGIQEHCKVQHSGVNHRRRGGNLHRKEKHSRNRTWNVDVACQRFFEYRQWQRLFAVHAEHPPVTPRRQQEQGETANRTLDSIKADRATKQADRRIQGHSRRCEANPWLDFVGWHRHLGGHRTQSIMRTTLPAQTEAEFDESVHETQDAMYGDESEAALTCACQATKRMIRDAYRISTAEHVGRAHWEPSIDGRPASRIASGRFTGG
ncbi:hypothetical protein KC316_g659 [Hortaea werneckii]|nr:hypothetical protein KC324_g207 [Hortaea werneckii]KAI7595228.1 hypothetical protein KC316_g659 [Hortaea werneckii]